MPAGFVGSQGSGGAPMGPNFGGQLQQEMDSESAQNLFSKAQVHEVIKGLNVSTTILINQIREGLFSDEDIKMLEGGYSVSDTEDEMNSVMNDILSAHSYYQSKVRGGLGGEIPLASPQLGGGSPNEDGHDGIEVARFQQFNTALMSEISNQRSKFAKKYQALER